jgi:uncharacterized protein (DUF433 family)
VLFLATKRDAAGKYHRSPAITTHDRIEINPEIMGGKPVIRDTRVPVEIVLRKLGAGHDP